MRIAPFLLLSAPLSAAAVPLELSHQGRLFDASGVPLEGTHDLVISLYDVPSSGAALWSESLSVALDDGYFHVVLGQDASNPLSQGVFDDGTVYLGLRVGDDPELSPRALLTSVPFAVRASTALALAPGASVDVDALSVGGVEVIGADGRIPYAVLSGAPGDQDTLATLSCEIDEVPRYDGLDWTCASDADHAHDVADLTGTLDITQIPVGTGEGTVAAGDHTHTAAEIGAMPASGGRVEGAIQIGGDSGPCDVDAAGTMRFLDGVFAFCDGSAWIPLQSPLGTKVRPGRSCAQILDSGSADIDRDYWIDPNGGDPSDAFLAWCDMSFDGGGWTRVASMTGALPICSLEESRGTPSQVADAQADAWLSSDVVAAMGSDNPEVMIRHSSGATYVYRSTHAGFTWPNIADGTIGPQNVGDHQVETSWNGGAYRSAPNEPSSCTSTIGSCLLGARIDGDWGMILGIGAYDRGTYVQDESCASLTDHPGLHRINSWSQAGTVYVR